MKDGLCDDYDDYDDYERFWMTVAHDVIVSNSRVASFVVLFGGAIGNVIELKLLPGVVRTTPGAVCSLRRCSACGSSEDEWCKTCEWT